MLTLQVLALQSRLRDMHKCVALMLLYSVMVLARLAMYDWVSAAIMFVVPVAYIVLRGWTWAR